tara:strand:+ start:1537 stop:1956 length:420 start_codon:yes stop_codon:yes gene_type:complete
MAITQAMCTSFKEDLFNKIQDLEADTIKIALYTSAATLGATTTAYSVTNEVVGTGYTAGGVTLTSATVATSGTTAYVDFDNPEWTSATFTARGALIYNDTTAGDNSVAVLDFGGDFTVSSGTFRVVFPAPGATAIIRID